ncbi:uncharacterized protein V6R79_019692 [Siganus canaliculatus]
MLDYESVHDLPLLLDSAENRHSIKRLGKALGVPPQGFDDLFQYQYTSTYTLLLQLAQLGYHDFSCCTMFLAHFA